ALPLPALLAVAETVTRTLIGCAGVGLFILALRGIRWRPWLPGAIAMFVMFFATVDPSVTPAQTPLMLAGAASLAAIVWLAARYLLEGNLLAYPLAIALSMLASNVALLLQN